MSAILRGARPARDDVASVLRLSSGGHTAVVGSDIRALTQELCGWTTGVVADDNEPFFRRLQLELPLTLHRYASGESFNGWTVPECCHVRRATIHKNGRLVYDAAAHPLGVAMNSQSFHGELSLDELRSKLVTNPKRPDAIMFHCAWQYRPWDSNWAISMPDALARSLTPGQYTVALEIERSQGEMIVAEHVHAGQEETTIVFAAHTCHPGQANDDMAGVALLVRLFQWLSKQRTRYTYKLLLGPEHLGTVFYLRDQHPAQLARIAGGVYCEMPGSAGPLKVASSFLGEQWIDHVLRAAAADIGADHVFVPWREGAGNDETVWEAPGYEVPFAEVSRAESLFDPFPEYHTSDDTAERLDAAQIDAMFNLLRTAIEIIETNVIPTRAFDGLMCLSNPRHNLYFERPDPAMNKQLAADSERWGRFNDHVQRLLDGSCSALDMALKHRLPFAEVRMFLHRCAEKGLVTLQPAMAPRRTQPVRFGPNQQGNVT